MTDQHQPDEELGGEAACWAHLVCPECGAMESEGHRLGCPAGPPPVPEPPGPAAAESEAG